MSSNRIRAAWAAIIISTTFLGISEAHADRIVVLQFTGRKASVLRDKVAASLQRAGHTVTKSKVSSRRVSAKALKQAGKRADAVIGGKVESPRKGEWSIALSVNDPKQGTALGDEIQFTSESLGGLTKEVSDNVSRRVQSLLPHEDATPPAPAEPEPEPAPAPPAIEAKVAAPAEDAEVEDGTASGELAASSDEVGQDSDADSAAESTRDHPFARLSVRAGYVRRDFDFYDDLYAQLRKVGSNAWIYHARADLVPFKGSIGQRIGFVLSYEGVMAGSVRDLDFQTDYPVLHSELFGGVRGNYPIGANELGLELTVGRLAAGLDDPGDAARVPDLGYTELRSAIDVKRDLGAFNVAASLGLRFPLGYGEASETRWFPRMGGYGAEAGVELGYRISKTITLEAAGSLRRYLIEMNSVPQDALTGASQVASGAVDRFLAAYLGARVSL